MNAPSNGGPAFPYAFQHEDGSHIVKEGFSAGMSLRAFLCSRAPTVPSGFLPYANPVERHVKWAVAYSDGVIAALEGRPISSTQ